MQSARHVGNLSWVVAQLLKIIVMTSSMSELVPAVGRAIDAIVKIGLDLYA